jgi:inosine-uridine nucleoside N-ribohydrolase
VKTQFTEAMLGEIARSPTAAAQYVAKYTREYHYLWDELAAAAIIDPAIITKEQVLYVDVDTARGPNYGDTLSWTEANRPKYTLQPVHVQVDLDSERFDALFVELMKAAPPKQ